MRLNQNMFSLKIYNNYKDKLSSNSKAINNISSGLKLNKAKDNPIKITQSQSIKIQLISNSAAQKNSQDTASMIQTFDGAMSEMNNSLARIKELTVQAGNSAMTDQDRESIQKEIDQLVEHITYTANNTEFNKVKLIDSDGSIETMIGSLKDETTTIPKADLTAMSLGIDGLDVINIDNVDLNIEKVDLAISKVSSLRSKLGAIQKRLEDNIENISATNITLESSQSRIADADIAEETLLASESQIFIQSSISLMAQSNQLPKNALEILKNIR